MHWVTLKARKINCFLGHFQVGVAACRRSALPGRITDVTNRSYIPDYKRRIKQEGASAKAEKKPPAEGFCL